MQPTKMFQFATGVAFSLLVAGNAFAAETTVAVAANFTDAAKEIAAAFHQKTGHDAVLSFGARRTILYADHAGRAVPDLPVGGQ